MNKQHWYFAMRHYLLMLAGLNLLWEIAQLPLYTIWQTGSTKDIIIAVLHCTAGDVFIAISALILALMLLGTGDWPKHRYLRVSVFAVLVGQIYTIYSERVNLSSGAWGYSDWMPIIPWLEVGLTPVVQWIVIPIYCFWKIQKPTTCKNI